MIGTIGRFLVLGLLASTLALSGASSPAGAGSSSPTVVAGFEFSCALLADGSVRCWGGNGSGQLGLGDTERRGDGPGEMGAALQAVDLGPGAEATAITAGNSHVCALLADGTVRCWGENDYGQLGLGDTEARGDGPGEMGAALPAVDLGAGRTAVQVSAGALHTCALLDDDTVRCWGFDEAGALGLGDTENRGDGPGEMGAALPAVDLGPGAVVTAIVVGAFHTCALLDDGSVRCWGYNAAGELGLGDTEARGDGPGEMGAALPAVDLGAGVVATSITGGGYYSCALLADSTLRCWGANSEGQLGLGDTDTRGDGPGEMGAALPSVDLGPGAVVVSVAAGSEHTCALLADGTARCWGLNGYGALGLGDTTVRGDEPGEMGAALPPVDLGPGATVVQITAGNNHTCAVLGDRSVRCWGANHTGELGLGDTESRGDAPGEMGAALPPVDLPVPPQTFLDVGPDHEFYGDVEWLAAEGIAEGYQPGPTFRPLAPVTRQAMSAFLYRLAGEPTFVDPPTPRFVDVSTGHPFFTEVEWMAAEGITTGYPGNHFLPAAPVSRQAMSAFLYRLAGEPTFADPANPRFVDVGRTHPFFTEVEWMAAEDLTTGYAGGLYRPLEPVSRQAMSAFVHRLVDGPGVGIGG